MPAAMAQPDPSRDKRLKEWDQAYFDAREDIATALRRNPINQRESIKLLV